MRDRLWAIYGFPFGRDIIMNNRLLRFIPICPSYGMVDKKGIETVDQTDVLLKAPADRDVDVTVV